MKVAIHQPNYVPWCGYCYKLIQADLFVFLDDVQFTKNSYINRTKITSNKKSLWLSIPVKFKLGDGIKNVQLAQEDWIGRHLSKLKNVYKDSLYYKENWMELERLYLSLKGMTLLEINKKIILTLISWLDINIRIESSSNFPNSINLKAEDRLIDIIKRFNSRIYFSGVGAKKYQNEKKFQKEKIKVIYSDFKIIERRYLAEYKILESGTSILDLIFFLGRKKTISILHEK